MPENTNFDPLDNLDTDYLVVGALGHAGELDMLASFICHDDRVPRDVMEKAIRVFLNTVQPYCLDMAVLERQETMDSVDLDEADFHEALFQVEKNKAFDALKRSAVSIGTKNNKIDVRLNDHANFMADFMGLIGMARLHQEYAAKIVNAEVDSQDGFNELEDKITMLETMITEQAKGMPGIEVVRFNRDPRGGTVRLMLTNGESNSLAGGFRLPVSPWVTPEEDTFLRGLVESRLALLSNQPAAR